MLRSIEIWGATSLALTLALGCGGGTPVASKPPPAAAAEPDPAGPPMYKPSASSPAPLALTDPAYGEFSGAPNAPGLGATIPDFEVPLADGGTFSLAQARAAGPVLLFFYRGFW